MMRKQTRASPNHLKWPLERTFAKRMLWQSAGRVASVLNGDGLLQTNRRRPRATVRRYIIEAAATTTRI
jgi:hypothetical protein